MSAIKRFIEDIGVQVHTGNLEELKDLIGSWPPKDQVNILLEGIAWNAIGSESCECITHNLKAYSESEGN
jgi:hypothetical protein